MKKKRTRRGSAGISAGLTREIIEEKAGELVEFDGLDALSMRALGKALGVEAMSLYHHFPSKAHLLEAMLVRLISSHHPPPADIPWRERMREAACSYRTLALKRPNFARYWLLHRMNMPEGLEWIERMARIFLDAGFDTESAARNFRIVGYYLIGAILDETSGYSRGPGAANAVSLEEQPRYAPSLQKLERYFTPEHWEKTFLTGLDFLLDSMEKQLKRPR